MKKGGYTPKEMKAGGYSAREIWYVAEVMRGVGFTVIELKAAGYSVKQMKAGGYTSAEMKAGACTVAEMKAGVILKELKALGYTPAQLKAGGYGNPFCGALFDEFGVLYQIGTAGGTREYQNPHVSGDVQVTSSSLSSGKIEHFVAHSSPNSDTYTKNIHKSRFMVDLKEHRRLQVTHYCLRHGYSRGYDRLQNWRLEGSNDGNNWTTLRNHNNDQSLPNSGFSEAGWAVDGCDPGGYRFLRILQHGSDSSGYSYLMCAGIEFYGVLKGA